MGPVVFKEFERVCSERKVTGSVLEIGALPRHNTLLNMECLRGAKERIGINLLEPSEYEDIKILQCNANRMDCFEDEKFDLVLCNAVLEHDKHFWLSIAEIKRVTKSGGMVVICGPGYKKFRWERRFLRHTLRLIPGMRGLSRCTLVTRVHNAPGDYYRYSEQAVREMFFEGMKDVKVHSMLIPPRVFGVGIKP